MKYEITIGPATDQYCGQCTYKKMNHKGFPGGEFDEWYCMLFDKILSSWGVYELKEKPTRCGDCKLLTERFMNMPELDEIK